MSLPKVSRRKQKTFAAYTVHPGEQGTPSYLTFTLDGGQHLGPGQQNLQSNLDGLIVAREGLGFKLSGGPLEHLVQAFAALARKYHWNVRLVK